MTTVKPSATGVKRWGWTLKLKTLQRASRTTAAALSNESRVQLLPWSTRVPTRDAGPPRESQEAQLENRITGGTAGSRISSGDRSLVIRPGMGIQPTGTHAGDVAAPDHCPPGAGPLTMNQGVSLLGSRGNMEVLRMLSSPQNLGTSTSWERLLSLPLRSDPCLGPRPRCAAALAPSRSQDKLPPTHSITTRSKPTPAPPCGGAPYLKESM